MKLTFESATDEPEEGEALDVSSDGLFIQTAKPAAVGKRLAIEVRLPSGDQSWSALGRVMWSRTGLGATRPSGMGVQLIDIDEAALDAIQRLLESLPPARERTVRGVGVAAPPVVSVVRPRRRRGRAEPVALLLAAAVATVLSLTHDRNPVGAIAGPRGHARREHASGTRGRRAFSRGVWGLRSERGRHRDPERHRSPERRSEREARRRKAVATFGTPIVGDGPETTDQWAERQPVLTSMP